MNILKRVGQTVVAAIVGVFVLGMIGNYAQDGNPFTHDEQGGGETVAEAKAESAATGINAQTPVEVHPGVEIVRAEAKGATVIKHMEYDIPLRGKKASMKAGALNVYCSSNEKFRVWRDNGISQKVVATGKNGNNISIKVTPSDCEN